MTARRIAAVWAAVLIAILIVGSAGAWHGPGHDLAARGGLAATPNELPAFFRDGADTIAHCALDPDNFTKPIATGMLHQAEAPEHYIDMELVDDIDKLPPNRYAFLETVYARGRKPVEVGLVPYAVTEWTQRLTVAFAEHRAWPKDPAIQAKCLVYAGILSHYAADLCQPLHTTIHYDGRVIKGAKTVRGIHKKLDAALGKLAGLPATQPGPDVRVAPFGNTFAAVIAELKRSHALVGRVYELEADLPAYEAPLRADSPAVAFLRERAAASQRFIGSLFLAAWRDSEKTKLPEWHHRPPQTPDRFTTSQPESR